MDFTKFYPTQAIKASELIDATEKAAKTALTYVPEPVKVAAEKINQAGFEFARAQAAAYETFAESVQKAFVPVKSGK